jgi:hypothetical protein
MVSHAQLGGSAMARGRRLKELINRQQVSLGGNSKLKIYGTMQCAPGKRMKVENRVFFASEAEAIQLGYRPCGHCMSVKYKEWKNGLI